MSYAFRSLDRYRIATWPNTRRPANAVPISGHGATPNAGDGRSGGADSFCLDGRCLSGWSNISTAIAPALRTASVCRGLGQKTYCCRGLAHPSYSSGRCIAETITARTAVCFTPRLVTLTPCLTNSGLASVCNSTYGGVIGTEETGQARGRDAVS